MVKINLDPRTAGLAYSGVRSYDSTDFEVTSGQLIEGSAPILVISFKEVGVTIFGGGAERNAWNGLKTELERTHFCWTLLLNNLTRGTFQQIVRDARAESLQAGVQNFKQIALKSVAEFASKFESEIA